MAAIPMQTSLSPLYLAARDGHHEKVCELISSGVDVNRDAAYGRDALRGAVQCLSQDRDRIVKALIKAGANVNSRNQAGWTPLHWAVFCGAKRALQSILQAGAEVDAVDDKERTPLLFACGLPTILEDWRDMESIVALLLRAGANPNAREADKSTPFHGAAVSGQMRTVRALIARKVLVNVRDLEGRTPLHYAALGEESAIAKLLIEHGAWRNVRDKLGQTPDLAQNKLTKELAIWEGKRKPWK